MKQESSYHLHFFKITQQNLVYKVSWDSDIVLYSWYGEAHWYLLDLLNTHYQLTVLLKKTFPQASMIDQIYLFFIPLASTTWPQPVCYSSSEKPFFSGSQTPTFWNLTSWWSLEKYNLKTRIIYLFRSEEAYLFTNDTKSGRYSVRCWTRRFLWYFYQFLFTKCSCWCLIESLKKTIIALAVTFMKQRTNTKLASFLLAIFIVARGK